jgi:pimeloyl-ACP methyl ester carboxylesterase
MRLIFPLSIALVLSQCGLPSLPPCAIPSIRPHGKHQPLLTEAQTQWAILADPSQKDAWPQATTRYNRAIRTLFDRVRCGGGNWEDRAREIDTSIASASAVHVAPDQFDSVIPADQVRIKSKDRVNDVHGIGFSAIGWSKTTPVGIPRPEFTPPNGKGLNLTAILDFSTSPPQWKFFQRWVTETCSINRQPQRMTADWTAPIDYFWYKCDLDNIRLQNLFIPERFTKETGMYFLRPYDPKKIPVVMVHGLFSSPETFRYIINDLSSEPWFRENYQIWLYNYPTGAPWLYNAMRFREDLTHAIARARTMGSSEKLEQMVIVSHSMGGLLARAAVSDPGTHLYDAHYRTPIDQLPISKSTRARLRQGLLYQPITTPKRVIFMAVPHQGSPTADLQATALISRLIKLPSALTIDMVQTTLISIRDEQYGEQPMNKVRMPTALSSLSYSSKSFTGLRKIPLPKNVRFHSIIGDRGKGDTPHSSDGVVPYWSSSVSPVESEIIVPSNHSVPRDPAASQEVLRILLEHLQSDKAQQTHAKPQGS